MGERHELMPSGVSTRLVRILAAVKDPTPTAKVLE